MKQAWDRANEAYAELDRVLRVALPEIIAVVKAVEQSANDCEECGGAGWDLARADGGYQRVGCHGCSGERRALAALDKKLGV